MEAENFTEALIFMSNISEELIDAMPLDDSIREPYWVTTLRQICSSVSRMNNEKYKREKTKECDRFPNLRIKFKELLTKYKKDVFSRDFIIEVDGKRVPNDSWLRLDDTDIFNVGSNRGVTICARKKDPGTNQIDMEFPLSEMFNAARHIPWNRDSGNRNYTYCVIASIYLCVKYSNDNYPDEIDMVLQNLLPYTEKQNSGLKGKIDKVKPYLDVLLTNGFMTDEFKESIDSIEDMDAKEMSTIAKGALSEIKKMSKTAGSMSLSDFLPGSADMDVDQHMKEKGISTDKIQKLIDKRNSSAMSADELLDSIPKSNE